MLIGQTQKLVASRQTENGVYLTDGAEEVLLPNKQCPPGMLSGDEIEVFVYTDSEDRPIATRMKPKAVAGEFAMLTVVSVTREGTFFDWGLEKDLFCARKEEQPGMREGKEYLVAVYLDPRSNRVACSTKINRFLEKEGGGLRKGQKVRVMVSEVAPDWLGVIVDGRVKGAIFPDERVEKLRVGDVRDAYVKWIRAEDGRVAISLRPQGYEAILGERERVLAAFREAGGELPVSDKSSPEEIQRRFGMSKAAFKKLLGSLYREGLVELEIGKTRLRR